MMKQFIHAKPVSNKFSFYSHGKRYFNHYFLPDEVMSFRNDYYIQMDLLYKSDANYSFSNAKSGFKLHSKNGSKTHLALIAYKFLIPHRKPA